MKKPWQKDRQHNSLPEVFSSINVPINGSFWKKLLAFTGPGLMVAVGYMDPEIGQQIFLVVLNLDILYFL
jgi:manganese transport protein